MIGRDLEQGAIIMNADANDAAAEGESGGPIVMSNAQRIFVSWTTDVLIYVVVLNLFVEFSDAITIDSFWISVLTAVVLKVLLDLVIWVEHRTAHFWSRFSGALAGWLRLVTTLVVLIGGKLFILYAVEQIFGDEVHLGHFVSVFVLVLGLLGGSLAMHWIYDSLGPDDLDSKVALAAA